MANTKYVVRGLTWAAFRGCVASDKEIMSNNYSGGAAPAKADYEARQGRSADARCEEASGGVRARVCSAAGPGLKGLKTFPFSS